MQMHMQIGTILMNANGVLLRKRFPFLSSDRFSPRWILLISALASVGGFGVASSWDLDRRIDIERSWQWMRCSPGPSRTG